MTQNEINTDGGSHHESSREGDANRRRRRRRIMPLLGVALLLSGFGYLLYGGIGENLVYFLSPSELMARGPAAQGSSVRLGGVVVPETVHWNADELDLRFRIGDGTTELDVQSRGAPPQMFRDGIEVVVEGRLDGSGVFHSTNLMVKHSNEYRAPEEGERPHDIYQELIRESRGT
ncbi:MAG: cytochrome c maturation protein CcmE [Gemmatimonadota bacterium]